jgi:ornithine carbamoyltransferase
MVSSTRSADLDFAAPPRAGAPAWQRLASLETLSKADALALLDTARRLERAERAGMPCLALAGKRLARLGDADEAAAFARAAAALGARVTPLARDEAMHAGGMLGKLYDAIDACGLEPAALRRLERASRVPVTNGFASSTHPLRTLVPLLALQRSAGASCGGGEAGASQDALHWLLQALLATALG